MRMQMNDPTLTEMEKARLTMVAPYNLDAWDEYAAEREILYATLKKMNKKVVILAGDTHNAWTSDLYNQQGEQVGLELATSSVSSPGIEQYLNIPIVQLQQFEMAFMTLIDELNDCNLNQRGYLTANFTAQQMQANWVFVSSIKTQDYTVDAARCYQILVDPLLNDLKQTQKIA